jgi:EAL domain-containing protein (putative c-di-GMP-specific phosphodiesterase class I)/GGDEF domain-containing protein
MRQLWLLVLVSTVLAFAGSLFISILSAKDYLTEQLQRKNSDNAASLALSMTQQEKDEVMIDLQVAALFDTGYYQKVSVIDPHGKVISQRVQDRSDGNVPEWFIDAFPIESVPGIAQVNDGWKQYGVVTVVSHNRFAYQALWEQAGNFLLWFIAGGAMVGAFGMGMLRVIGRSLGDVVRQATAIKERRFITVPEPKPVELRTVTVAMNDMVARVKTMFAEEAHRLEEMRTKVNRDAVTGLSSRDYFMSHLHEIVGGEHFGAVGSFVLMRLTDIDQFNATLGHQRTNVLLKELGTILYDSGNGRPGQRAGRLKGGEFAVVCPTIDDPAEAAKDIYDRLQTSWLTKWGGELPDLFHIAAVLYQRHQNVADLMVRADSAIAQAAALGPNTWYADDEGKAKIALPADEWRNLLTRAVSNELFSLAYYPILHGGDGRVLHEEGVIRLHTGDAESVLAAGDFMPMAAQLNLTAPIDLGVVKLAIRHTQASLGNIAVNLSAETIGDFAFRNELTQLLKSHRELCARLLFEVPEYGVFRQFDAFIDLVGKLKGLGCRVGIEYFGQQFVQSDRLASLGLDYIKVHPSYVRGLAQNPGNQEFLKGLCRMAHNLGIEVIALGVESKEDLGLLVSLGFDGATGPGIRQNPDS